VVRLVTTSVRRASSLAVSLCSSSICIDGTCPGISMPEPTVRNTYVPRTIVLNDGEHHSVKNPTTKDHMWPLPERLEQRQRRSSWEPTLLQRRVHACLPYFSYNLVFSFYNILYNFFMILLYVNRKVYGRKFLFISVYMKNKKKEKNPHSNDINDCV